ncbi:hypothetical protein [Pelagicoccus sp. SDUM812003]|uniref:hypothetical protein n=1 Tax=Pelagicoccus sp. SDUM812003 TaxID=3041267 RepID=UPI00280F6400|nr:hypothetical protein [Pelagicoccus sp. SDUM812003]MDQ8202891.1 hypothetical protein [Pelagicoccus sp. SDUM812003]
MPIAKLALIASACFAGLSSQASERLSETSVRETAPHPSYALKANSTDEKTEQRIRKLETFLQSHRQSAFESRFQVYDHGSANAVKGKASMAWKNAERSLSLYVEGSYEARLRATNWKTTLSPSLGMRYRPSQAVSIALAVHSGDRGDRGDSDQFHQQPLQSHIAIAF